jgi:hypothetical protein
MNTEERLKIYEEVQKDIFNKFGERVSIQEIDSIVNSQFKIMSNGFTKNLTTIIPCFGKFIPIDKKYYNKYIIEPNKQKQKELIEEGKEQEAKDIYIESVKKYKSLISAKRNESSLSANEVILIVNSDNIPDSLDILKNLR